MDLIVKYIVALTNLYGLVSVQVVTDIYNDQNEEWLTEDDVAVYLSEDLSKHYVYSYKGHFVHETIMEFNDFKSMKKKKADKPYYIPDKEELLKYSNMSYYELPKQYDDLLDYVKKNFFPKDDKKAEMLCENIRSECIDDFNLSQVFHYFNLFEVNFKDENQASEVMDLVMNLSNSVRLWENNGYTPNELFEKLEKPNLKPLPNKPFDSNVIDIKSRLKIGRNDPCPCGSGKKYKRCCLRK